MPKRKSKKIFIYFFLFCLIGTINNKNLNDIGNLKLNQIEVSGLNDQKNLEIKKKLETISFYNLFFLDKLEIKKQLDLFKQVESYTAFKKYPSSLDIKVNETNYLAYVNKGGKKFILGSNGNLINLLDTDKEIPYIFGDLDINSFFKLKEIIDQTKLDFNDIQKLFFFPSGRWDLEMNSGILIKLSRDRPKESLELSLSLLKNDNFNNIKIIDVRQQDQVIING